MNSQQWYHTPKEALTPQLDVWQQQLQHHGVSSGQIPSSAEPSFPAAVCQQRADSELSV